MITEQKKIAWNPYFYSAKMTLAQLLTLTWPSYWLWKPPNLAQLLTSQHIYIYGCGVIIWAKFGLLRCYYLGQVCFFTKHCLSKNAIKIGVSALFVLKKNCTRKFEVLLSGPSWSFLRCSQLGPDNNTYLAQILTPQNAFFCFFLRLKICWNTYFYSVFWASTTIWQKRRKKTITFHILQNTGS